VDIVKWGLVSVFVVGCLIGFGAWIVLAVESVRAVLCLTPEARQHRYFRWNWFNALLRPECFSKNGLLHRRRAFVALLWFLGGLAVSATAGFIAFAIGRYGS
jgi:hypothetical protein